MRKRMLGLILAGTMMFTSAAMAKGYGASIDTGNKAVIEFKGYGGAGVGSTTIRLGEFNYRKNGPTLYDNRNLPVYHKYYYDDEAATMLYSCGDDSSKPVIVKQKIEAIHHTYAGAIYYRRPAGASTTWYRADNQVTVQDTVYGGYITTASAKIYSAENALPGIAANHAMYLTSSDTTLFSWDVKLYCYPR